MGDLTEEYRNVEEGAGWWADARRGRLTITGADATAFLQALVTAEVEAVGPTGGVYGAYLTPQGRMIADLALYRQTNGWLADVPASLSGALAARLDGLIFTEDVQVADVTATVFGLSVAGAEAPARLAASLGLEPAALRALALRESLVTSDGFRVAATDLTRLPTFAVFGPAAATAALESRLAASGVAPVALATAETFRVEAGRPLFGLDMDEATIPLEAGLADRAISTTKGCYVGQEVIIRVLHRGGGRVARRLMCLEAEAGATLEPGAALLAEGAEVGEVTSAAWSPSRQRSVGLGYVKRDTATAGTHLRARASGSEAAVVITGQAG